MKTKLRIPPKERLTRYRSALKTINVYPYLCIALCPQNLEKYSEFQKKYEYEEKGVDYFLSHFLEVYEQRPKKPFTSSCWFKDGVEIRKTILKKAIKKLETKMKK